MIPNEFWMMLDISHCSSLPCTVTIVCSFNLTTASFEQIALFHFDEPKIIYHKSDREETRDESVLEVDSDVRDVGLSHYIFNVAIEPCETYQYVCRTYEKQSLGGRQSGRFASVPFPGK